MTRSVRALSSGLWRVLDFRTTIAPPVIPELDFDAPLYRSSAFHWSSKLILLGSRIMASVVRSLTIPITSLCLFGLLQYALKPGITLQKRQAAVPELHLALEHWCVPVSRLSPLAHTVSRIRFHELPSHLRASMTDATKAPHPHIIGDSVSSLRE